jgi:glycine oxidase
LAAGVEFVAEAVVGFTPGEARLERGGALAADLLVLAVGAASASLAAELVRLAPVKGHILRLAGGPLDGPVVRGDGIYVRPHPQGAWVGATMEAGRTDRTVDAAAVETLMARARVLFPHLGAVAHMAATGVRATTDDGLPLVGAGATPGVLLCVGARRNGWLLGPLAARLIGALAFGEDGGKIAATLSPARA